MSLSNIVWWLRELMDEKPHLSHDSLRYWLHRDRLEKLEKGREL